jgi:hypothetical protein
MIQYDEQTLQFIEDGICCIYDSDATGYPEGEYLLDLRKRILNEQACTRKAREELLPDIIAFNDALHDALKRMYDRAHELYRQMSAIQPDIMLTAKCYLAYDYPALHPYQKEDRQELFNAISDFGWNSLYADGVTFSLVLPRDIDMPFDTIRGMDCTPFNWNEGLDPELTKDLHINRAFHNLFDHTKFALTDFIFCRDFVFEFSTINEEKLLNRESYGKD